MTILLFSFQFRFLLFLFFGWLLWLGLPKLYWVKVVESVHPRLVPDLWKKCFLLFTMENDVSCGLVKYGLYFVEICILYAHFINRFITNGHWMLSKVFLHLLTQSYNFYTSVCYCGISCWLIYRYWTIFTSLEEIPLDDSLWSF